MPISRGERGPGASGEHDGRHQRAELAQHGDAHPVHDEDHRAELPGDEADLERDDHAHEKAGEQDDRHRVGARLGGHVEHVAPLEHAAPRKRVPERVHARTEETRPALLP